MHILNIQDKDYNDVHNDNDGRWGEKEWGEEEKEGEVEEEEKASYFEVAFDRPTILLAHWILMYLLTLDKDRQKRNPWLWRSPSLLESRSVSIDYII